MKRGRMTIGIGALLLAGYVVTLSAAAEPGVTLVGFAEIAGDLLDKSQQQGTICALENVVAEKIEGMAWGPDLPDGRHLLYVTSDNDLVPDGKTQIYAFAVDTSATGANVEYQPQDLPAPIFWPKNGKKTSNP